MARRRSDIETIKEIISRDHIENRTTDIGTVVGIESDHIRITLRGSARFQEADLLGTMELSIGDEVILLRVPRYSRWLVLGPVVRHRSKGRPTPAPKTVDLAPPAGVNATGLTGMIVCSWDAPLMAQVAFEVQHGQATGSVDTISPVDGSYFIYIGEAEEERWFRVRSVNTSLVRSGWSGWVGAQIASAASATGSGGGGGATLLSELLDTEIVNPQDSEALIYSSADSAWINSAIAGSGVARVLLFDEEVSGDPATITFDNIPQGYDHLEIWAWLRGAAAVTGVGFRAVINDDTGNNYHRGEHEGGFDTAARHNVFGTTGTGDAAASIGSGAGASGTSGWFAFIRTFIPDYSDSSRYKVLQTLASDLRATNGYKTNKQVTVLWADTDAITKLFFYADNATNTFAVGTRIRVYGIKDNTV